MKLAVIFNKDDHKLRDTSYSYIYKGMLDAVIDRFEEVQKIHSDCSAKDIDADLILFYDIHSSHHIKIEGIKKHPAIKMEYFSDPYQEEVKGVYQQFNMPVHKLGRQQRIVRALERGIDFIICPVKKNFFQSFSPIIGQELAEKMLLYFPLTPSFEPSSTPLAERIQEVLGNGSIWDGKGGVYDFRRWAFKQPYIHFVEHFIKNPDTPSGKEYGKFLSQFAGALALNDLHPVPKYYEMPLSGCITFAQHHEEYEDLGFKDFENCIYVNQDNFEKRIKDFLSDIQSYQKIADAGRKLMEENYTAKHFADFLYDYVEKNGTASSVV